MFARSFIAAVVAALLLAVGAVFLAGAREAALGDFMAIVRDASAPGLCRALAWGALAAALLTLLTVFAAFFENDDPDDYRRRGLPKAIPALFFAAALGLYWLALGCASHPEKVVIAVEEPPPAPTPVEPEPEFEPAPSLQGSDAPPEPQIVADETALIWAYSYPLITGNGPVESQAMRRALAGVFPADDPSGAVRAILCDKAWVAVTGAASEEGPRPRNLTRARLRAEAAAARIDDWLDRHESDCPRPALLAVDLGQHEDTGETLADAGRETGYQRQMILITRERAREGETLSPDAALAELRAFYAANPSAVLGGRRFVRPPAFFIPPVD